jgi:hypothetical protein
VQLPSPLRLALGRVGRFPQISLRHQVRVDVVVGDRAVLVGTGDAVDPKTPLGVVVTERAPQACRLDQQLEAGLSLEVVVFRDPEVAVTVAMSALT